MCADFNKIITDRLQETCNVLLAAGGIGGRENKQQRDKLENAHEKLADLKAFWKALT